MALADSGTTKGFFSASGKVLGIRPVLDEGGSSASGSLSTVRFFKNGIANFILPPYCVEPPWPSPNGGIHGIILPCPRPRAVRDRLSGKMR